VFLLYDLILSLATLVLLPYYLLRGLRYGKVRRGIRERLGALSAERLEPLAGRPVIWVHAVSVGETRAAVPLIKALKARYPDHAILLSNVTETGHAVARGLRDVDLCLFFPFDLSWVVRRVLAAVRPQLAVIVETEIWPNFVRQCHRDGIPVLLVNGRISDRSFPRYRRVRWLLQPVLRRFSAFCMQSQLDAERIVAMGAAAARVEVTRNLKFDMQAKVPDLAEVVKLKAGFRLSGNEQIWVAGSTHAGEEEAVVQAYGELLATGHQVLLVLVPRHPERCRAVAEMLGARGLAVTLRSRIAERPTDLRAGEVLLVDSIGEMLSFYALADLVFVGGSLVDIGGHNILEASLLKKPVLFGPFMHNFKEISRLLAEARGGIEVANGAELTAAVGRLLADPDLRQAMGQGGYGLLADHAGATAHTLRVIARLLGA
jgi:3-deoxy-D-manno-octulosonic-acid transferase